MSRLLLFFTLRVLMILVQSFEYFIYQVSVADEPGWFLVAPAWGYPLQWGESYEDSWTMSTDSVLRNFDVKEQDLQNLSGGKA